MRKLNCWKTTCAVCVLCAATAVALSAQTFTTLYSFCSQTNCTDGNDPFAGLVQATDGNLYGTTVTGGANGAGTIFKISPSGTLTTLYSFCSQSGCADGANPYAGPVQATDGNFYGITYSGGANVNEFYCPFGCGTIFKVTPSGTLTTLYSFCSQSNCTDGEGPAGLVHAIDGNLYGTTVAGGANCQGSGGCGTAFKMSPSGTLTTLYSFCSQSLCTDGYYPYAGLVQATDGNFYGTTGSGGAYGYGTVFKITPGGTLTTLYSFCSQSGCTDGYNPSAALVQATDGNFYGTTGYGGANLYGTVFKITPSGTLTTLYSFCSQSGCTDGESPVAGLVQATDGNFYGTTYGGGANGLGTVFKITPSGTLTTLHSFAGYPTEGAEPLAGLAQATNGILYGATGYGGTSGNCTGGCGTIFNLGVGLGPFVETQPASGKVGKFVKILGTNLTHATSVTFNGTPAVFKVVSASEITTSVPSGATTGTVQVTIPTTPRNTLSSNVPFRVLP